MQRLLEFALALEQRGAGEDDVARLAERADSPEALSEACRRLQAADVGSNSLAFSYLTGALRQKIDAA